MTTSTSQAPLVFFRVLASQAGIPAALLMDIGPGNAADVLSLFDSEQFLALGAGIPCYYRTSLAGPLAEALAAAGWKQLVLGTLFARTSAWPGKPLRRARC